MRLPLALALALWASLASAQEGQVVGPVPPCSAYGTASGTCAQGNDSRITGAAQATVVAGSWTPIDSSGASLTFSLAIGTYNRIGNMVFAQGVVTYPTTVNGANALIGGLPVNYPTGYSTSMCAVKSVTGIASGGVATNSTTVTFFTTAGAAVINSALSLATVTFQCVYPAT